jgi:hypothetical protein
MVEEVPISQEIQEIREEAQEVIKQSVLLQETPSSPPPPPIPAQRIPKKGPGRPKKVKPEPVPELVPEEPVPEELAKPKRKPRAKAPPNTPRHTDMPDPVPSARERSSHTTVPPPTTTLGSHSCAALLGELMDRKRGRERQAKADLYRTFVM